MRIDQLTKTGFVGFAALAGLLLGAPGCDGGSAAGDDDDEVQVDGGGSVRDPFAALPDTAEGLTNVSADLDAVLERGALSDACTRWRAGGADRRTQLMCGKWMFFYEGFGTAGVPAVLPEVLIENFPDDIGPGFSKYGMVADPGSAKHLPLGMAPGAKLGNLDTLAFTCASCHFARLPDGRYAVGAANHAYQYGKQNLALAVFPLLAIMGSPADHDPDAIAAIQPLLDKVAADGALKLRLISALIPLAGASSMVPMFPREAEHHYARWPSGTMDFLIEPLPLNDRVHTISKISALWGLPRDDERTATGMAGAQLGWTGSTSSLMVFLRGFVELGGGKLADWPDDKLAPLAEYVYSLRTPAALTPPPAAEVARGRALFDSAGCNVCHDGPRGSGKRLYGFDEVGTDRAMEQWLAGPGFMPPAIAEPLTRKLKSPRLTGAWAFTRFLHNGSVQSLEALLCMVPRVGVTETAYGDAGHDFGCALPMAERQALVSFLKGI